ncbi:MAG: methylmalonyl-CoA epimerase [Halobacteriovoraceae bacterium]|jgi:methylmalonyl-CoA/ethylmalonyl-CoA epimerase|nr:methylmalonyl-CoA epimerase [Halobacteriovoraceae bacterium]MBT5094541.1 methylmalonyl-CoA epimerase [Halobacteriovoraceae bacterium]
MIELKKSFLDHVAIAVPELDPAIKIYEDLGFHFSNEREEVASESVVTAFASIDTNAHLELLSPLNGKGPIQNFLDKKGAGIHHLCFQVPDVLETTRELREKGYQLIHEEPKLGAKNCLVNFIHPKSTGGVLIEISTPQK